MDALPQAVTDAWLNGVASNPVLGAAAMILLVFGMNWIKATFPALLPGGHKEKPAEPDRAGASWQVTLADASEHAETIADALRLQVELLRRQVECLERTERLLAVSLAPDRTSPRAPREREPAPAPRTRPAQG